MCKLLNRRSSENNSSSGSSSGSGSGSNSSGSGSGNSSSIIGPNSFFTSYPFPIPPQLQSQPQSYSIEDHRTFVSLIDRMYTGMIFLNKLPISDNVIINFFDHLCVDSNWVAAKR